MQRCPRLTFQWVPSHGKKEGWWQPPDGFREKEWRDLNERADKAATAVQERLWRAQEQYRVGLRATRKRTQEALQRVWRGAETFRKTYPHCYAGGGKGGPKGWGKGNRKENRGEAAASKKEPQQFYFLDSSDGESCQYEGGATPEPHSESEEPDQEDDSDAANKKKGRTY